MPGSSRVGVAENKGEIASRTPQRSMISSGVGRSHPLGAVAGKPLTKRLTSEPTSGTSAGRVTVEALGECIDDERANSVVCRVQHEFAKRERSTQQLGSTWDVDGDREGDFEHCPVGV